MCYRRARELSYTILELKNAVTGGYVVPKEQPSACDIRTAVSRMLLGQPKAKPGADRRSRAGRRLCNTAAARSGAGDSAAVRLTVDGSSQAAENTAAQAEVADTRRHHSAPAPGVQGLSKLSICTCNENLASSIMACHATTGSPQGSVWLLNSCIC